MLTNEQQFFIDILCDFVHERSTSLLEDIDYNKIQQYGRSHGVTGIVYHQTKRKQFQQDCLSTIYGNITRKETLIPILASIHIPYCLLKGIVVANLYKVPELRTMGDIDILVHESDKEFVHSVLLAKGFVCHSKPADREWQYRKGNLEIELHHKLIYIGNTNNQLQDIFFNENVWEYVHNNELDWNFHFLYMLAHIRKHFMNEGAGLRMFLDLAIVVQRQTLDWNWIMANAEKIGLLAFMNVALSFCNRWFSIDIPSSIGDVEEQFYESTTIKILNDGIFGYGNKDNAGSLKANIVRSNGNFGIAKYVFQLVFPSYFQLCNFSNISFIKGRPYLLPLAWGYRWISYKGKWKAIKRTMKNLGVSKDQVKKREELYKHWGL